MHDLGRRLARPAPTFWAAASCLAAVIVWGSPAWAYDYSVFVAVTAAACALATLVRTAARRG